MIILYNYCSIVNILSFAFRENCFPHNAPRLTLTHTRICALYNPTSERAQSTEIRFIVRLPHAYIITAEQR